MTVAVVGGTGTVGRLLGGELLARGVQVRVLSRDADGTPAGAEHRRVDLTSGEGLPTALDGVATVVDAANSPRSAEQVLVAGTRRLLSAGEAVGVLHHVAISSYFRAKVAQEREVTEGPVAWTVLRATQFHQLLDEMFSTVARYRVRPTGQAKLQPIDALGDLSRAWQAEHRHRAVPLPIPAGGKAGRALAAGGLCNPGAAAPGEDFESWLRHG